MLVYSILRPGKARQYGRDWQRFGERDEMTLNFPNLSRSFDTTPGSVRFSGYDDTREIPFFVEEKAIRSVAGGVLNDAEALLLAFDLHRARICKAAGRVYAKRREGSYTWRVVDF